MSRLLQRSTAALATVVLAVVGLAIPVAGAAPAQSSGGKCPLGALEERQEQAGGDHVLARRLPTRQRGGARGGSSTSSTRRRATSACLVVNQSTYADTLNKFRAGLSTGDLPDLVNIEDTGLQQMIDTQAVLPASACVKADKYDLSDNLERVVDYYSVKGTLWPMPFNVSNPVLYFNKKAFQTAGLDPNNPPKTLDEVKSAAQKLKDSGTVSQAGFGMKLDPWYLEQWSALGGKTYVNNGNGRKSRATSTTFDNATGKEIFTFLNDMVTSGSGSNQPRRRFAGVRQPARDRQRQLRHDDRHVGRARHDPAGAGGG